VTIIALPTGSTPLQYLSVPEWKKLGYNDSVQEHQYYQEVLYADLLTRRGRHPVDKGPAAELL
jgi:hypothetical protein